MNADRNQTRVDKTIHVLPWISLALLFAVFVTTLWVVSNGVDTTKGLRAQRRSDELRSCSTSFAAELVTGPTAAALKALADHGADSPQFRDAVNRADPVRYIALARLSRTDPAAFLRACRRATP